MRNALVETLFTASFEPNGERWMRVGKAHAESLRFAANKISKVILSNTEKDIFKQTRRSKSAFQYYSVILELRLALNERRFISTGVILSNTLRWFYEFGASNEN